MKTTITKCLPLGAVALAMSTHLLAAQTPPATVTTAEPKVGGRLVCLPVAFQTQAHTRSYMFGLRLDVQNTSSSEDIRWQTNKIEFTYPSDKVTTHIIERDLIIVAGATENDYLDPKEVIELLHPPPVRVRMELYFKGYSEPLVFQSDIAVYSAPTPSGAYQFPGSAADFETDQLWTHSAAHSGGSQLFAYDFTVVGWDKGKNDYVGLKPGGDGTKNEDFFGWGVPVYSMADGIVLWVRSDYANNPKPRTRAIQRMAEVTGGGDLRCEGGAFESSLEPGSVFRTRGHRGDRQIRQLNRHGMGRGGRWSANHTEGIRDRRPSLGDWFSGALRHQAHHGDQAGFRFDATKGLGCLGGWVDRDPARVR